MLKWRFNMFNKKIISTLMFLISFNIFGMEREWESWHPPLEYKHKEIFIEAPDSCVQNNIPSATITLDQNNLPLKYKDETTFFGPFKAGQPESNHYLPIGKDYPAHSIAFINTLKKHAGKPGDPLNLYPDFNTQKMKICRKGDNQTFQIISKPETTPKTSTKKPNIQKRSNPTNKAKASFKKKTSYPEKLLPGTARQSRKEDPWRHREPIKARILSKGQKEVKSYLENGEYKTDKNHEKLEKILSDMIAKKQELIPVHYESQRYFNSLPYDQQRSLPSDYYDNFYKNNEKARKLYDCIYNLIQQYKFIYPWQREDIIQKLFPILEKYSQFKAASNTLKKKLDHARYLFHQSEQKIHNDNFQYLLASYEDKVKESKPQIHPQRRWL